MRRRTRICEQSSSGFTGLYHATRSDYCANQLPICLQSESSDLPRLRPRKFVRAAPRLDPRLDVFPWHRLARPFKLDKPARVFLQGFGRPRSLASRAHLRQIGWQHAFIAGEFGEEGRNADAEGCRPRFQQGGGLLIHFDPVHLDVHAGIADHDPSSYGLSAPPPPE
jgi:hypothetical protein